MNFTHIVNNDGPGFTLYFKVRKCLIAFNYTRNREVIKIQNGSHDSSVTIVTTLYVRR